MPGIWEAELGQIDSLLQPTGGDPRRAQELINALKVQLLGFSIFGGQKETSREQQLAELVALRDLLECAALCAIDQEDESAFQSNAEELLGVYFDERLVGLGRLSSRQALLLSLILTWHLSRGRLEVVHVCLRRLEFKRTENASILGVPLSPEETRLLEFPLLMDRDIMDGNIAKVLAVMGSGKLIDRRFQWFSNNLVTTLRRRAAQALEAGYQKAPFDHVMKVLVFENPDELLRFIDHEKRRQDMLEGQILLMHSDISMDGNNTSLPSIAKPMSIARTSSVEVDRPSTPTQLPKAGEGRVFSSLARTSSTGQPAGSGAFALKATQALSREFVQSAMDVDSGSPTGGAVATDRLVGLGFGGETIRPRIHWKLGQDEKGNRLIYFVEVTKPKPLIPAYDLMSQWLNYATDLEAVV